MTHLSTQAKKNQSKKFEAAWDLFADSTISLAKFDKIRTLLKGLNPQLDTSLTKVSQQLKKLKQIYEGDVISLSAGALPEKTPKEKKRKKALLAFLSAWKSLKSEVKRVEKLLDEQAQGGATTGTDNMQLGAKILRGAKGPLGLITAAAVLVAVGLNYLQSHSVAVTVTNDGCDSLVISRSLPFSIPGLKIPQGEIPDGSSVEAVLPPLTFTVNAASSSNVSITAFKFEIAFELDPGTDLIFNGSSLLGKTSTLRLAEADQHSLVIQCSAPSVKK